MKKKRFNVINSVKHLDTSLSNKILGKKTTNTIQKQVQNVSKPTGKRNIFGFYF